MLNIAQLYIPVVTDLLRETGALQKMLEVQIKVECCELLTVELLYDEVLQVIAVRPVVEGN